MGRTVVKSKGYDQLRELNLAILDMVQAYGLDPFDVAFEVLTFEEMNQVAAYGGFPTRYPHWHFGMEYERLRRSFAYGLHRIYEMVINNDPCYAYLLEHNKLVDHKLVMAHVYAHADFFKNNLWFSHTNRRMLDEMANHATRMHRYVNRYGAEDVERFLDLCLSVDDLIDPNAAFDEGLPNAFDDDQDEHFYGSRFQAKDYMDTFINPPLLLEAERKRLEEERKQEKFPPEPQRDVLYFLLTNAPLKNWQADVLAIIREESYYFLPQRQTKIMNEGWATYWHSKIMTEGGILEPAEVVDYADHHAGTVSTSAGQLNPYKLGVELFRFIEDCADKGRLGKEWEECTDMAARRAWDRKLGLGRERIFEVRKIYNDLGFIDTFLTKEFVLQSELFVFEEFEQDREIWFRIVSRDFDRVKSSLLNQLTNGGRPIILVEDGNYDNRGELLLRHQYDGVALDKEYADATLANIQHIWTRPVHIATVLEDQPVLFSFDGKEHSKSEFAND
jgi:stage V sporulation protein R